MLLSISDLDAVLELLQRHRYDGKNYYKLGLSLGLSCNTLDDIVKKHDGDTPRCLLECLKKWLKQADGVKSKGGATYHLLLTALRDVEETGAADGIDKEKHPACAIFATYESNHCIIETVPQLALFLYKEKMIGEMMVSDGGTHQIMMEVKEAICADHSNLEKFAAILKRSFITMSIAEDIIEKYKSVFHVDFNIEEMALEIYQLKKLLKDKEQKLEEAETELQEKINIELKEKKIEIKRLPEQLQDMEVEKKHETAQKYHIQSEPEDQEVQKYRSLLQKKEAEREQEAKIFSSLLQEKVKKEAEQEHAIQQYCNQLQEHEKEKEQLLQQYHDQLKDKERKEAEKDQEMQRYHNQLQEKEKEVAEKDQEIQMYRNQLQEKEKEKDEEIQRYHNQLQEKEKGKAEKDQEIQMYLNQLQGKEIEILEREEMHLDQLKRKEEEKNQAIQNLLQLNETEIEQRERDIRNLRNMVHDSKWAISADEMTVTDEELGRGSYAIVRVGIFRGLRVAVKSLHNIIISDYNRDHFSREMNIASQVRHPNLVQFIGATKVGHPLLVTELMSTSLYKELQVKHLTNEQIFSISRDVALGLNYLHHEPIIHRDVSSSNVLLDPLINASYKAKVADYGTAKLQYTSTGTGTEMPGNPYYAAPEAQYPDQHSPSMDVYSYSVLLMEMSLHSAPEATISERAKQAAKVTWPTLRSLIQSGIRDNYTARPSMTEILASLNGMYS